MQVPPANGFRRQIIYKVITADLDQEFSASQHVTYQIPKRCAGNVLESESGLLIRTICRLIPL